MKPSRLRLLAARREQLVAHANQERERLVMEFAPLAQLAATVDAGFFSLRRSMHRLAMNPFAIGAALAIVVWARPRRLVSMLKKGAGVWLLVKPFAPRVASMIARILTRGRWRSTAMDQ
jgi:branched-subunit amino acid transport protein